MHRTDFLTWLPSAASKSEIEEGRNRLSLGVWVEPGLIRTFDLGSPFQLGRRFDAALCLEVAEHLSPEFARTLIDSLCSNSDLVFFSAAAPGQRGECHINCQKPEYWQNLFNQFGYACVDDLRMGMWDDAAVRPWYRQNVFRAFNSPEEAGKEPRIPYIIHPEMTEHMDFQPYIDLENGMSRPRHYLKLFAMSLRHRLVTMRDTR